MTFLEFINQCAYFFKSRNEMLRRGSVLVADLSSTGNSHERPEIQISISNPLSWMQELGHE